jgi:D-xylose transport system substrate-binding protein
MKVSKMTGALAGVLMMAATTAHAEVKDAVVGFLMPDQASTRYEERDFPGFAAEMKKLCESCKVLYLNADGDATKQQQQFNSVISQGAKVIVLDAVDTAAAASLVKLAQSQDIKVGKSIAESLIKDLKAKNVPTDKGGVLQINGSPTDAAAGLIKKGIHAGLKDSGYKTLAEYDTPEWAPSKAQQWASGQITRFNDQIVGIVAANDGTAGGAIAAMKAAGIDPLPPITGNDATIAALQLIISGDQFNTINKPSEIVASEAARIAAQLLNGETPKAETTLYNTPSKLFVPAVVTAENLKAEIIDKNVVPAATLCVDRYADGCKKLGITN